MSPKAAKNNSAQSKGLCAADLMPKNKEAERVLHERANYLAIPDPDIKEKKEFVSYIRFRLGTNENYGIPYHYAKEVIQYIPPTKIPFVPDYIAGVINRRGALLPVFDLKQIFHIQAPAAEPTHIILITDGNMTIGILASRIEGSDTYDPSMLDASLTSEDLIKPDYIVGLHQGMTAIINVDAILSDQEGNPLNKR